MLFGPIHGQLGEVVVWDMAKNEFFEAPPAKQEAAPKDDVPSDWLTGFAPGQPPDVFKPGQAKLIPAGSDIVLEVHYMPERKATSGSFRKGPDARRHVFTHEERSRGGLTTAQRYLCTGRWHLDWWDRCHRKVKTKGGYIDAENEEGRAGETTGSAGSSGSAADIPY